MREGHGLRMVKALAIFGGLGLAGSLILWFGVTRFWAGFDREKFARLPPDKARQARRRLAAGCALFLLLMVGVGVAFGAGH